MVNLIEIEIFQIGAECTVFEQLKVLLKGD